MGERVTATYLNRLGFVICAANERSKFGELDIIAQKDECLHIVEVKSLRCLEFSELLESDQYHPGENLHRNKIAKVVKTAEWYVNRVGWEGEWQIDGALVWLRERDGVAKIRYLPQIL